MAGDASCSRPALGPGYPQGAAAPVTGFGRRRPQQHVGTQPRRGEDTDLDDGIQLAEVDDDSPHDVRRFGLSFGVGFVVGRHLTIAHRP